MEEQTNVNGVAAVSPMDATQTVQKKGAGKFAVFSVLSGLLGVVISTASLGIGLLLAALSIFFLVRFRKNSSKKGLKTVLTIVVVLLVIAAVLFGVISAAIMAPPVEGSSRVQVEKKVSENDVKREAEKLVNAKYMSYILNDCVVVVDITTVSQDGDQYTVYGKVKITDPYKDTYTGRFTIVLESRSYGLAKISEDYETPYK